MKRCEKLKRWIKDLIKQNSDDLQTFDYNETKDPQGEIGVKTQESVEWGDDVDVTVEDLFEKLSSIWDTKPQGHKKVRKSPSKKSNKIILQISGDEPIILPTDTQEISKPVKKKRESKINGKKKEAKKEYSFAKQFKVERKAN